METLSLNERMEIILNLTPKDIVKYCSVNKKTNREICESDIFWRRKLEKDYPKEMNEVRGKVIRNPKHVYIKRFTTVAYKIEKFVEAFITFNFGENFNKILSKEYKEELFDSIYTAYERIKKYNFSEGDFLTPNEIKLEIMSNEIAKYYPEPVYEYNFEQMCVIQEFIEEFIDNIMKENIYEIVN